MQTFWHLADVGDRTCDMLLQSATTPEQMEKTTEVQEIYQAIKELIENEVTADKAKKGRVSVVKREVME